MEVHGGGALLVPDGPVTKQLLTDWLTEVADDAEIGIDVGEFGQLDLLAIRGNDVWILALESISYPAEKAETRERMMKRLIEIHSEGGETEKGVVIVTNEGVVSGDPDLFSMSFDEAFTFRDRAQAQKFIKDSFDVIRHALIIAC